MRLQETRLRETILSLESLLESIKKVNLQCKSWGFELDVVKGPRAQLPKQSVGLLTKIGAPAKTNRLAFGKEKVHEGVLAELSCKQVQSINHLCIG